MLSFPITEDLTKRLKSISDIAVEKSIQIASLSDECKETIKKYARISNIGSTTRIENALLTDTEVLWIDEKLSKDDKTTSFFKEKSYIENKLSKERERSIEEVVGCRNMYEIIYSQFEQMFPLSESSICGLHRELLQFYPPAEYYLGKYKTVPNNVVEKIIENGKEISQRDVLKTADPGPITESSMRELVTWYNQTLSDYPWTIAVASEFVFRFLAIHPFQDGNGRIGRALFSLSILQSTDKTLKTIIPYLAIDRHIEKRKGEYYQVLQKCSGGKFLQNPEEYKISYFLDFMLRIVKESLKNDIDFYVEKYRAYINLSESQRKVLNCFKEYPEKMLALKDILQFVHVPRRTAIYAINSLMQKLFLQKFGRGPSAKYRLTF